MRKTMLTYAILACMLALTTAAQAEELPKLETKVKTLAVFKNGLGFVFRSGNTSLADGWADMAETPPAALGTLWIGTTNPLERVEEVIAYKSTPDKERDPQSLAELVDLNVGKELGLTYTTGSGEAKWIQGKVLASAGQIVLVEATSRVAPATGRPGTTKVAIKKDSIQSVDILSDDATLKAKDVTSANRAKVHIGGKARSAEITMAYLEKGIIWTPSYLINIRNDKTADITLEAVLANDVEDLDDTDVSFVVGYPSFQFSDITTPLSLQQSVASFVSALSGQSPHTYGMMSQVMNQSVMYNGADYTRGYSPSSQPSYSAAQPMAGESNEDLYLYSQPHVTLKKGDRARYQVFTAKVPYEHVYEWDVPDSMNVDSYGNRSGSEGASGDGPNVWHVLRLENTTSQPWTTAAALAVSGSMPVAQDILRYTPPKAKNTLKLTVATDVRATMEQIEAGREQVGPYDKITVKGKLTIHSYKSKTVKLSVKKSIVGEVSEASDKGKIVKLAKALTAVNSNSQVSWEFELAPDAEKVLSYQYTVMIHR